MTALEVVDVVGSWKLGGTYEDENAANTQLRLLNIINTARQRLLREYYLANKSVPQVCYQEFDIEAAWTEVDGCLSFVAQVPKVVSLPEPKMNGWDSIVPLCEHAMPLTEVRSQNMLRSYMNHSLMKNKRTSGWYIVTGDLLSGYLKPKVKATGLTGRAILASPEKLPSYNIEKDQYPLPDDMITDMQRLLDMDYAKRWMMQNSQVSNSKTEIDGNRKL